MTFMRTIILNKKEVESILTVRIAIDAVENAFRQLGEGKVQMPPRVAIFLDEYNGAIGFMPAYLKETKILGLKEIAHYPKNQEMFKLPNLLGLIILCDPETGYPLAIMDAAVITSMRTGAAGAIGAKYLARKDFEVVGLIGTGKQGLFQIVALNEIKKIKKIKAYDIKKEAQIGFLKALKGKIDSEIELVNDPKDAAIDVDVLITATTSTQPIVKDNWLQTGMHITAIGADMPMKSELCPEVFKKADKIVVDSIAQAFNVGEFITALSKGIISKDSIYAEIGEIVAGKKTGRENDDEITIFKSTGLAVQDVATASRVYEIAKCRQIGAEVNIID